MQLTKAVLVSGGTKGLQMTITGYRKVNEQFMSKYEDVRKDKLPVPVSIRNYFQKLKYFFLTMIGMWESDYTKFLVEDYSGIMDLDDYMKDNQNANREGISFAMMAAETIFQKTFIDGYEIQKDQIKIFGTYENIDGKPFTITMPFILESDDYAFFQETIERMRMISDQVIGYVKSDALELKEVKQLLLELENKNEESVSRIENQDNDENYTELMIKLESQALIFPLEGSDLEKMLNENNSKEYKSNKAEIVSKNTIDEGKVEPHVEVDVDKSTENNAIDPEINSEDPNPSDLGSEENNDNNEFFG